MHHTILRPDTRTIRRRSTCPLPRSAGGWPCSGRAVLSCPPVSSRELACFPYACQFPRRSPSASSTRCCCSTGGPSPSCCTSDSSSGSLAPSAPRSPSGFLCTKGVSAWLNGSVTCEKSATPGPRPLNHSKCCARAEDGCQQGGHACGGGGFRMHAHLLATVLAHAVRAGIVVVAARKAAPIAQPRFLRSLGLTVRVGRRRHCRLEQWGSGLHKARQWGSGLHDPGRNDDGGPWNIVRNSGHWPSHSKGR